MACLMSHIYKHNLWLLNSSHLGSRRKARANALPNNLNNKLHGLRQQVLMMIPSLWSLMRRDVLK